MRRCNISAPGERIGEHRWKPHPIADRQASVHDLGDGFTVRRMLPVLQARHVGPFVFFDHIGPAAFAAGKGMDVRPHPHIGLATVTWLFDGAIRHRDSLGSLADIRPGEVNWMTAGRGIVHSERTPPDERAMARRCTACRSGWRCRRRMPRSRRSSTITSARRCRRFVGRASRPC